jgi:hypothetical protein
MPAAFNRYSIYAADLGGILLTDISDQGVRSNSRRSIVIPGGSVHPRAVVLCCADPVLQLSTKDLAGLFGGSPAIGSSFGYGVDTAAASPTDPAILQFQRRTDGGTFEAAGDLDHVVGTVNKGFLHVTDITAAQDDVNGVRVSLDFNLLSADGLTQPVTFSNAAVLTGLPAFDGIWYMGPVRIGTHGGSTTLLPGVQRTVVRPMIAFRNPRGDGQVFATNGSIHSIPAEIRITTADFGSTSWILNNMFGQDQAAAGGNFNIFYWKGVHGGARVAAATAVHYMVTAATGATFTEDVSVREIEDGMAEIVIVPTGGITISANQAIN